MNETSNFKATPLSDEALRTRAPSIFASGPMMGVSQKYTFVPTSEILTGLRDLNWVPVEVEEQRIRQEARRGFQKHLIRLRLESQMATLDEWNVELVVVNSHDAATSKSEAEAAAQRQGLRGPTGLWAHPLQRG